MAKTREKLLQGMVVTVPIGFSRVRAIVKEVYDSAGHGKQVVVWLTPELSGVVAEAQTSVYPYDHVELVPPE